jgi:NAD(P)-dependent dehydrogenase (short-subunit alcohol dehydrogenase family)
VLARAKPDRNAIRNVQYCACDLSEPESACSTAIETTRTHGPINYLIFCQRFRGHGDSWQGEFAISVDATRALIEGTTRSFASEGDRAIAIVSSVYSEFVGDSQPASYHATKAAVNQLARYYAVNLGKSGIRVNSVSPFTFLKDESSAYYTGNRQVHNLYQDIIPLGRMGTAADSANLSLQPAGLFHHRAKYLR